MLPAVEVTVSENNEVGLTLATVTAVDRDVGENASLHFSFRRCTPSNMTPVVVTSLNSTSAVITAAMSFDYETHSSQYECHLSVCDSGTVTSLCADDVIVRVHATDVDDQRPKFDKVDGYYFTVEENKPAGTLIGKPTCARPIMRPACHIRTLF